MLLTPTRFAYTVASVEPTGDSLAVTLAPAGPPMRHQAGQFAFLRVEQPNADEAHPFTISSAPTQIGGLRFTIKPLDDYAEKLEPGLQPGAPVQIEGPHGRFINQSGRSHEIWIGAGVGITPFLARANALPTGTGKVDLFYCIREPGKAAHLDELSALANENLSLHVIASRIDGRLTIKQLLQVANGDLSQTDISFCGPGEMRDSLRQSLENEGLPAGRFHCEDYEM